MVILIAVIYYKERTQATSAKGKGVQNEFQRKLEGSFQKSFPKGATHDVIPPASN